MSGVSVEDKKAWLCQGLEIQAELLVLKETRQLVYEDATNITQNMTIGHVSGSRKQHKFDKLVEIDDFIAAHEKELISRRAKLLKAIYTVDEGPKRQLLVYRYIHGMTGTQIADKLNYSERQIHRIRKAALEQIRITPSMIKRMKENESNSQ